MNLFILLQAAQAGAETAAEAPKSGFMQFLPLILIFLVIWLFMIRPQNKKQKEIQKARAALQVGDRVVTSGGIYGKLRDIKDDAFIIEISENVRIRIEKTAVFAVSEPAANPSK